MLLILSGRRGTKPLCARSARHQVFPPNAEPKQTQRLFWADAAKHSDTSDDENIGRVRARFRRPLSRTTAWITTVTCDRGQAAHETDIYSCCLILPPVPLAINRPEQQTEPLYFKNFFHNFILCLFISWWQGAEGLAAFLRG